MRRRRLLLRWFSLCSAACATAALLLLALALGRRLRFALSLFASQQLRHGRVRSCHRIMQQLQQKRAVLLRSYVRRAVRLHRRLHRLCSPPAVCCSHVCSATTHQRAQRETAVVLHTWLARVISHGVQDGFNGAHPASTDCD